MTAPIRMIESLIQVIRTLVTGEGRWQGTATELLQELDRLGAIRPKGARALSILLRRSEPALWWTFRLSLRFHREGNTGRRLITIKARE